MPNQPGSRHSVTDININSYAAVHEHDGCLSGRRRVTVGLCYLLASRSSLASCQAVYWVQFITLITPSAGATSRAGLRSATSGSIAVPRTTSSLGDHSFTVAAPRALNNLPSPLRRAHFVDTFRHRLNICVCPGFLAFLFLWLHRKINNTAVQLQWMKHVKNWCKTTQFFWWGFLSIHHIAAAKCFVFNISELIYTERSHVRQLKVMSLVFYEPMCDNPAIDRKIIDIIFPNLEDLLSVHSKCCSFNDV